MSVSEPTVTDETHIISHSVSQSNNQEVVTDIIRPSETSRQSDTDSEPVQLDIPRKPVREDKCNDDVLSGSRTKGGMTNETSNEDGKKNKLADDHDLTRSEPTNELSGELPGGIDVHSSVTGERVERLKAIVKQYQDILHKHKDISQFLSGDVLTVAEKCWQQIHSSVGTAVEDKHEKIFEAFQAFHKLSVLDSLASSQQHKTSQPAWRPSGIPNEDHQTMSRVEAKHTLVPQYKQQYEEAKQTTQELHKIFLSRKKQLGALKDNVKQKMNSLSENSQNTLSPVTPVTVEPQP